MVYRPALEPLTEDHPLVPPSPYGLSKLAQELLGVRASTGGVAVTIARAFNHLGPRQDPAFAASGFAKQIAEIEAGRREPVVVVGNLDARRDTLDVRDTVRAYRTILRTARPAGRTTSARERPSPSARCWRCSSPARVCRSGSKSIRIASGRTTCRCCSAIRPGFARSWDGRRRCRSLKPSMTSWRTGERPFEESCRHTHKLSISISRNQAHMGYRVLQSRRMTR